jgi:LPS sulfotransferase NodH
MRPRLSYTIWSSQRTGSTLLCKALEATGIAGNPNEWLIHKPDLQVDIHRASYADIQHHLWNLGSTANGVFGLKYSFYEPHFGQILETLRKFPNCPQKENNRTRIWEHAFPNHRHIFMTRRNKVRLAVSSWKAINTQEWHRLQDGELHSIDLTNAYSFEAIKHLYCECSMREAGVQEFFSEGSIVPLNIAYEDFIEEYERTIKMILEYLELDAGSVEITPPHFAQLADGISEEWTQRFREEVQNGWQNRGW